MTRKTKRVLRKVFKVLNIVLYLALFTGIVISFVVKVYALTTILTFALVYGLITRGFASSIHSYQDYADSNTSGSDKYWDYDARPDSYIDRDYK